MSDSVLTPQSTVPVRVGMISLGCAKNLVDSEFMLGALIKDGIEIVPDTTQADVVIINTCSFIDAAQEESVDTILESAELRKHSRPDQGLVVAGCLPQRFRKELPKLMPEVDAFMGIDQVPQIADIVRGAFARGKARAESIKATPTRKAATTAPASVVTPAPFVDIHSRPIFVPDFATPRFRLTPRHFAYLRVADGCNHPCSFCIIPRIRGRHRSRTQPDVVQEARQLLSEGVKELNLISQDSTYYGLDLQPERRDGGKKTLKIGAPNISTLLRELNALPGEFWIRLLYTHPAHWTDELIQTIAECDKVARYVDIPLQHIHPILLERMRRETTREYITNLIGRIRKGIPGIALRTTFIVGFPGETEACFKELLEFIRQTRFERLGVFAYSKEDGTRAAGMEGQLTSPVRQKRRQAAMAEQHKIAIEVAAASVGKTMRVLVEGGVKPGELAKAKVFSWEHGFTREQTAAPESKLYSVARSQADAPDIDGKVYVAGRLPAGEFATVKIIGHTDYDLIAEPVA